jgi:outer membrane protein assembly factor BamB
LGGALEGAVEGIGDGEKGGYHRKGNYMQSPILIGKRLYGCNDRGALTCFNASDGSILFSKQLRGNRFTASPVSDGRHLYVTCEYGEIWVVKVGDSYQETAINAMGDNCLATPAIAEGVLYYRTQQSLIAIGNKD